jgi:hypothetical protein
MLCPTVEQSYVQHSKGRFISTTSPVGSAHGMILVYLVSYQWALVTSWLSLDPYLLVGKCAKLVLDGSIMWTTTIAQRSSRILDYPALSYPAS